MNPNLRIYKALNKKRRENLETDEKIWKFISNIKDNDFVYMDPPYIPEKKGGFVSYGKTGFIEEKHEALFKLCNDMIDIYQNQGIIW